VVPQDPEDHRGAALLYLHGLSSGDFVPALGQFPGSSAGAKFPKAAAKITDDLKELLAFYDYHAGHWVHLRTTNPIVIWPSPQSGTASRSPRARARGQPGWRWRSS
jgi:hypothetical protein